jgi:hypothetical protein
MDKGSLGVGFKELEVEGQGGSTGVGVLVTPDDGDAHKRSVDLRGLASVTSTEDRDAFRPEKGYRWEDWAWLGDTVTAES